MSREQTTWDRHPSIAGRARVWRRDDGAATEFPWFYLLPHGYGSIARSWMDAMAAVNAHYVERELRRFKCSTE